MTVAANFPVIQRPWAGYTDPGLPVGMWIAQGSLLGDASGGNQTIFFNFKGEGEPLGARFYNLEQVEVHSTRSVTQQNGTINLDNFDIVGSTGLINRRILVSIFAEGTTNSSMPPLRLPIFVGRPQLVDLASDIALQMANVDLETIFFTGQGYIWEPRSLLMDGGLRRPLESLYG